MADYPATRAAALALGEEQRLIRQGYDFLDEKRMLLAGEIMRQLDEWRGLRDAYGEANERAREALGAAIDHAGRVEIRLAPYLALEAVFGEILRMADAGFGISEGFGDFGGIVADRRHDSEAGDNDTSHGFRPYLCSNSGGSDAEAAQAALSLERPTRRSVAW